MAVQFHLFCLTKLPSILDLKPALPQLLILIDPPKDRFHSQVYLIENVLSKDQINMHYILGINPVINLSAALVAILNFLEALVG